LILPFRHWGGSSATKDGRYGSDLTKNPTPVTPSSANTSGPAQQAEAMNAYRIEPTLAASDQLRDASRRIT
jgi:hypothetical protein